jgi:hypothetical protein
MTVKIPLPKYEGQLRPGVLGSPLSITILGEILDPKAVPREKQDITYGSFSATVPISFCPPNWIEQDYINLLVDGGGGGGGFDARLIAFEPWFTNNTDQVGLHGDGAWFQITAPMMPYKFPVHSDLSSDDSLISMPLILPKDRMIQA